MLTVWGRANSINVQKVLWACEELEKPYRRIDAGGSFGETKTAAYLALNPNSLVPTIEDDGFYLWESNVIVRYLCQKYSSGRLCPAAIEARFDVERWMDWQATAGWGTLRPVFISLIRTPEPERDMKAVAAGAQQFTRLMTILDAHLGERRFVGGDAFTMGDIPLGVLVYRWYALPLEHPPLPHLQRWYEGLTQRPAFRKIVMHPLS